MKHQISRLVVLLLVALTTASCMAPNGYQSKKDDMQRPVEFISAYFNLISYAKSEMKADFSGVSCAECGVRVIDARDVPKFVDIYRTGIEGEKLEAVQRAIATSKGRAVVLTSVPDVRTRKAENLVFLPIMEERFVDCPEATNAAFLTTMPQAAPLCGLRTFGQKGGGPHCAYCSIGICCGTCTCTSCNNFTSARSSLDLPERFDRLFDGSGSLKDYPVDVELVKRPPL